MHIETSFVDSIDDPNAFEDLLRAYYRVVLQSFEAAGGPRLDPDALARGSLEHKEEYLPPRGRLLLARNADGRLMGCGTLRRVRDDAVEMKRMFVRPEAQGQGLGQRLFQMRMDEARAMGCRKVYADTARGNRPMLSIYERHGFAYIDRYPENANPEEFAPFLVFLEYVVPEFRDG